MKLITIILFILFFTLPPSIMNIEEGKYKSFSDSRLKSNVESLSSNTMLDNTIRLRPVSFKYKGKNKKELGFIAQEVEKVSPELVDDTLFISGGRFKRVDYGKVVVLNTGAIQELNVKIESLHAEITQLKRSLKAASNDVKY